MQVVPLKNRFEEDGVLVMPGFKSPDDVAALRARAAAIVDAFDPAESTAIFTTKDESTTKSDDYFLTSGDKIRCFFEEEAFDASGALRQPKELSINKIGHAMHDLDPVFERFSRDPRLHELAVRLGIAEPRVYQSMYIFKQPRIGGEVRWHQDATYFETDPISVTTLWFALEDADRNNGCLWVQRGGHRTPLRERFVVDAAGSRLERSIPRRGRPSTSPNRSRSRPGRWSSCTASCPITARPTVPRRRVTRTRCTSSTLARATPRRTGSSAATPFPRAASSTDDARRCRDGGPTDRRSR